MKKFLVVLVLSLCAALPAYAEKKAAVEDFALLMPPSSFISEESLLPAYLDNYEELYKKLEKISDKAYRIKNTQSPEYYEHYIAGKYTSDQMRILGQNLKQFRNTEQFKNYLKGHYKPEIFTEILTDNSYYVSPFVTGVSESTAPEKAVDSVGHEDFYTIAYVGEKKTPYLSQKDHFLKPGEIILTFDDGPYVRDNLTADVHSILYAYKTPAVFFVLGTAINSKTSKLLTTENGIEIGVHGYYHATPDGKPYTAYDWATISDHLNRVKGMIAAATDKRARFFRPPYGVMRAKDVDKVISELELIPLGWTIDSMDWSVKSEPELLAKIQEQVNARKKGIILMHDTHPQSRNVLRQLIPWLLHNGYTIVPPQRIVDGFNSVAAK